jgi:2-oxoisovalerate dehydrogenase E1 component alpha subunit
VSNRNDDPVQSTGAAGETTRAARFDIQITHCLAADGTLRGQPPPLAHDRDHLLKLYRMMVQLRAFDQRAVALQRTGQLGTYAPTLGQEAVGVAIGDALRAEDVLVPTYREYGAQFMRGVRMEDLLLYWGGDERGMDYAVPREDFPISVPIATHAPHAAGVAYAFKLRRQPRVALCVVGDGATSKGDFYEALNLAGVWHLPVVFVVINNEWAISVPRAAQSAAETLAQKAIAGGIPGEQVDGNDLFAAHARLVHAVERARRGEPCLVEALTYRFGDHTTADDASRYREEADVKRRWEHEPIKRVRRYLERTFDWNDEQDQALWSECKRDVEAAVKRYLDTPRPPPEAMFKHLYAKLPAALASQRDDALRHHGDHDDA